MTAYAPGVLSGESVIGLARCPLTLGPMAGGVRRMPGPVLIAATRFSGSPVGPHLELVIGEPAHLGARVGWCLTTIVVDSPESRAARQANWGFPAEIGSLTWDTDGSTREMRWAERGIVVRGEPRRLRLPGLVPVRALQHRTDGPVVVPGRLRGMARLASVTVEVPGDDRLAPLDGRHPGITVDGLRMIVRPARKPFGLTSSLRAPLHAPEPALSSPVPRAYSSAG